MPTFAVLGGTGNTGSEIIRILNRSSINKLRIYARSPSKLIQTHPFLEESNSRHQIFTGSVSDVNLIKDCITGVDAVFGVVGSNYNDPDLRIAQDLAEVIIAALTKLKNESKFDKNSKIPTVIFCTSAGMTSDKRVRANLPAFLHWMIQTVGKYIYADFRKATAIFQRPANAWVPVIFFCAPGLMPGPSQGDIKIGVNIPKKAPTYVTYTDLARGMIQAVEEEQTWVHREIGIAGAKQPPIDYGIMMFIFVTNTMAVWAPRLWRYGHRRQWWG